LRCNANSLLWVRERLLFIFGFDKGTRSNITDKEEHALKIFGNTLLNWSEKELNKRIKTGELLEIMEIQDGR